MKVHRSIFVLSGLLAMAILALVLGLAWGGSGVAAAVAVGEGSAGNWGQEGGATPTATSGPACQLYSYALEAGTMISGTYDIGNHCDFCPTHIDLPFPVTMYGHTFVTATVTSQGLMAFGWAYTAYPVECLPWSNTTYGMAAFWVDTDTDNGLCTGCGIFTATVGTAPNRTFIVEWRVHYHDQHVPEPTLDFEIQLQEGQSSFKFVYGLVTSFEDTDTSLTIGLQKSTAENIWIRYYCDPGGDTAPPLTGKQLTWVYDPCGTPIASPTGAATATNTAVPTSTRTGTSTSTATSTTMSTSTTTSTSTSTNLPVATDTAEASATTEATATGTAIETTEATVTTTATATATVCDIEFTDVPEGSTFYGYVRCLACRGIISGYSSGCETGNPCFRPGNNVTRGQLSKIVANAAGFAEPAGEQVFEDVPEGSSFFNYVQRLANRGYIGGYGCGGVGEPCVGPRARPYFRPNGSATRGQISKIVANAAGWNDPASGQTFEDVAEGSTFWSYVERAAARSVIGGYECGGPGEPCVEPGNRPYFRPGSNATRGQVSKIVANAFFEGCEAGRR